MYRHITAVLLVAAGLSFDGAFAQTTSGNPSQSGAARQDQVPLFRVTVVGRTTPAINYRPRSGVTTIDFAGTPLLPQARGSASVRGRDGVIEINARFRNLPSASRFGPEYLTYVVWAVTPEGRATNMGELQVNGDDGELRATTELQAFGLIVTAEPYFAVTQPSDVVVMENLLSKGGTIGSSEMINVKYELLKRGSYLMNQDPQRLRIKPLEPGAPLDLAEARNAVALAAIAGADRYAADTFAKAERLLGEAERAQAARRGRDAIMMPARHAAQTAEDARLIALQRMEEEYVAQQRALSLQRETAALDRADSEEARRRQAEDERRAADAARSSAERATVEAERARADAERSRSEAERASARLAEERRAAEESRKAADAARVAAEARLAEERRGAEEARKAADAARAAAESQAQQAQLTAAQAQQAAAQAAAQAEREKAELRERLRAQLNVILETRETARGLIVNLSDVLFDTGSANLKPGAREKLAKISGILLAHPGLKVEVEGHTDSVGSEGYNLQLSERRATSVRAFLVGNGIPPTAVAMAGFGESQPVATNGTAAGRQQNRRVELIVSGDAIGRVK